ncbi:hypothetical protein D9615_001085 [Tricholomella constricta]|uniref:Uncharacterized protein n=1 Tax=Tricholomella constricta TaxID=117010 RepID=A0A8H5M904_9AGAR|nr:hypothetical protein D9615_001085 [Tricholomella constricta]
MHPALLIAPTAPPEDCGSYPESSHATTRPSSSMDWRENPNRLRPPGPVRVQLQEQYEENGAQTQILLAIVVGAPLIASVVASCLSVVVDDFASSLGEDPLARPARASAVITLLWCSVLTSLGSTMIAVSGLAMHAGYHNSHVGVTEKITRVLREWRRTRSGSPAPTISSMIMDRRRSQYAAVSLRASVVASRLLGVSVGLLAIVGLITVLVAVTPLLPILLSPT